jgi:hypothetical protein
MFPGVHDSLLVAYSISVETHELILSLQPHHGSSPRPFNVVFEGVAAHYFPAPMLPAILAEVFSVSAEQLLSEHWQVIERGYKAVGWPGPWADTFANATNFAQSSGVQGFQIESSYGLSGWVLAKSASVRQ